MKMGEKIDAKWYAPREPVDEALAPELLVHAAMEIEFLEGNESDCRAEKYIHGVRPAE